MTVGRQSAQAPAAHRRQRRPGPRWRHLARRSAWTLGSILTLLVLALAFFLGTRTGLRSAVALAEYFAPEIVSVRQVEGRVLGHLGLEGLRIHLAGLDVGVGSIALEWRPWALFQGALAIDRLAVADVDLALGPSAEKEKTPLVLPNIALPLRIDLREASLEHLQIRDRGATEPTFVLDHAAVSASLDGSRLQVSTLDARLPRPVLAASLQGHADLTQRYPLELSLDWTLTLPTEAGVTGQARVVGDLARLSLKQQLTGAVEADMDVHLQDVLGNLSWKGLIQLASLDLPAFDAALPVVATSARLETRGDLDAATLTGDLDARAPDLPDFGHLAADLDVLWQDRTLLLRRLDLREQVSEAALMAQGQVDLGSDPAALDLEGSWENLRWPLSGDLLARSPKGELSVEGSLADFRYDLEAEAEGSSFPSSRLLAAGEGSTEETRLERLRLETLDGALDGEGEIAWSPELRWDLRVRGKDLNPGALIEGLDDRLVLSLDSKGGLDGFDYDLAATSSGPGLPPASLTLAGAGDSAATQVETLRLDLLDGRIEGQAQATFSPQVSWAASLDLAGIDPGSYAPDWPGRIDGRLKTEAVLETAGPNLTAVIDSLRGQLRGYPILASGSLAMEGGTLRIQGLTAESGPSKASVQGVIGQALDLSIAIRSPDLASLLPGAEGSLEAQGTVEGPLKAPRVRLELKGNEVAIGDQGLAGLAGTADLDLAENGRFSLRLDGRDLAAGGLQWSTLNVTGEGLMSDHRLSAALLGDRLSVELATVGGLGGGSSYQGELSSLDLSAPDFGRWRLQRSAPFDLQPPRISLGPVCVRHTGGSGGCLGFDQPETGQWSAGLDLDKLDLALLEPVLPEKLATQGGARVKGRFETKGDVLLGQATAEIPTGLARMDLGKGNNQRLDFSGSRLDIEAGAQALSARLGLPLRDLGAIRGQVTLPGWRLDAPARPGQPLQGQARASLEGLDQISSLLPDIAGLSGSVDADLTLGGTLGRPGLKGQANVRQVGFELPIVGLTVSDLDISAVAPALDRLDLRGQATVGGGPLRLEGTTRFGSDGFEVEADVTGDRLRLADTKEYFALASPSFQIQASPEGARIRGQLVVPEARIRPRSVPSGAVSPSSDVVLEERDPSPPYPLEIDVTLALGDAVSIDAFGVRGRLAGSLSVLQAPGRDMLGDGQLQIIDGEYRLSGRFGLAAELGAPLTITQGRLVYAKSPIGNPGLLLQAERSGGDTSAGVRVLGTLRDPKLAFFSESDPGMTQSEITKYLVTGIPPAGNDQTDKAGLAVGTYVAPKIYMEYESGLGDEANKVKLRYELSPYIELQTETGDTQGADIYFTLEN